MEKIIIADSGSTKTDWKIISLQKHVDWMNVETSGVNPYFMTSDDIVQMLTNEWSNKELLAGVEKIYFYGAGCSSPAKCDIVRDGLQPFFSNIQIYVHHDLLAAARALFAFDNGIAGILGTGSNSCLYQNHKIQQEFFSLGYFFGDYGSGAHIGKSIVSAYLQHRMPDDLARRFDEMYQLSKEQILDRVYNQPNPNRFLAGFARFASDNFEYAFLHQIVLNCFRDYFDHEVSRYPDYMDYPLRFVGSIAHYFQETLESVAREYHTAVDAVIKNPADDLVRFHIQLEEKQ
ncbi:MAG: hypothetical protein R6T91_09910 [Bacteroidales bacterium]